MPTSIVLILLELFYQNEKIVQNYSPEKLKQRNSWRVYMNLAYPFVFKAFNLKVDEKLSTELLGSLHNTCLLLLKEFKLIENSN